MQIQAAHAIAARSAEGARAAQQEAADQLAAAVDKCAELQRQLNQKASDAHELRQATAHQAANAAAAAAERHEQALADRRLQLHSDFDTQLLQREAKAADALQQALDGGAEHRQMLMAQAAAER